jgi:hypothetical protein
MRVRVMLIRADTWRHALLSRPIRIERIGDAVHIVFAAWAFQAVYMTLLTAFVVGFSALANTDHPIARAATFILAGVIVGCAIAYMAHLCRDGD